MKFVVSSSALYSRLAAASKVMTAKNSMPILDSFLFDIKNGKVTITASDGEKYFITSVPLVDSDNNAQFCITAKTIMDSMKELAEQPLTFEYNPESHELQGRHQTGVFSVMSFDASTYPVQQALKDDCTKLELSSNILLTGINRCLFATANDEIRVVMTGIFLDVHAEDITFAGTDGRKLVRYINREVKPGLETSFILPKKVAAILKNVLQKDTLISICFDNEKGQIHAEDFDMYFRLVEGRYPNYNGVIPTNNPYVATIDRASLISALKRISVFCNQSSGLMKLHLENNQMRLTGEDNDYSTRAEENLMCDYQNDPISIGFSCIFLIEIANIMEGDALTIQLADPSRPGVVVPAEQPENEETLMLLMPMMLND
ncbi:MAG: DNA polymerase III subunit beta [Bacteroidaceae bacterium]|nr:DNA polymerase III subunit beta [Bacteroidaceae bacterium]